MAPDWPTETLPELPSLTSLYARAAAASSLARASRALPGKGAEVVELHLPSTILRVPRVDTARLGSNLRDYQRLVHELPANTLPGGFLHILITPVAKALVARAGVSLPVGGLFHVYNDGALLRPIQLGEVLDVRAWATDLRPHPLGLAVDLHATASADGRPAGASSDKTPHPRHAHGRHASARQDEEDVVWHSISTYVLRVPGHVELGDIAAADVGHPANPKGWQPPRSTVRWTLPHGLSRAYSSISGERNPLNLSNLAARSYGLPRAALQTAYLGARVLAELSAERGDAYRWTIDMARPVTTPTTLEVAIEANGAGSDYLGWLGANERLVFSGTMTRLG